MLIECPACHARAKLPDSKEGAKVRCPQCSRVYQAYPVGTAGARRRTADPTKYFLIGGAVLAFVLVLMVVQRSRGDGIIAAEEEPEVVGTGPGDYSGWNSELCLLARRLHELAFQANEPLLRNLVDPVRAYELRMFPEAGEEGGEQEDPDGAAEAPGASDPAPWTALSQDERSLFLGELVEALISGPESELVVDWEPFNVAGLPGEEGVVSETDEDAIVRLQLEHREDSALASRNIEWRFVKLGGEWKAYHWERWYSPDELQAERKQRAKKTVKRTLSDGSFVIESEVRPIPFMDETPPAQRELIQVLVDKLVQADPIPSPKELNATRAELAAIGKPAIPALLTKFAVIPLDSEENAILLNLVHLQLQDMTGYITTFKPHEALGATQERMDSGLKQWFGWYDRKFKKFTGKAEGDEPDLEPLSDEERREIERLQKEEEYRKMIGEDG